MNSLLMIKMEPPKIPYPLSIFLVIQIQFNFNVIFNYFIVIKMLAVVVLILVGLVSCVVGQSTLRRQEFNEIKSVMKIEEFDTPPSTVDSIILKSYLGFWYQTYDSLVPNTTSEKDGYCVTANYTYVNGKKFLVQNALNIGSPVGNLSTISGAATLPDPFQPGKWNLKLNESGMYVFGAYWIHKVGPIDISTKLYAYSVVTVPTGTTVYILARNVTDFKLKYEANLLAELSNEGFNSTFNTPLPTYQGSDCKYS